MNKRLLPPRLADLIPGATWRAASIAARVGFLLLVFPLTLPGELGAFFSYSSLGVLVGRVISFGALDNLPIKVRGNTSAMVDAYRAILPLSIMAILATFAAASTGSLLLMSGAFALSLASGLALAGAVRSVNAALFEQWRWDFRRKSGLRCGKYSYVDIFVRLGRGRRHGPCCGE